MRITLDEAFRLQDRFEEWVHEHVGQDVLVRITAAGFRIEVYGVSSEPATVGDYRAPAIVLTLDGKPLNPLHIPGTTYQAEGES